MMIIVRLAQVNPNMPRTFGDGIVHKSHLDVMVSCNDELRELVAHESEEIEDMIGKYVADTLVKDGATLQMGRLLLHDGTLDYNYCYKN